MCGELVLQDVVEFLARLDRVWLACKIVAQIKLTAGHERSEIDGWCGLTVLVK
jgi:hypothetical protein